MWIFDRTRYRQGRVSPWAAVVLGCVAGEVAALAVIVGIVLAYPTFVWHAGEILWLVQLVAVMSAAGAVAGIGGWVMTHLRFTHQPAQ